MLAIRIPLAVVAGALFSSALFLTLWQLVGVPFEVAQREEAPIIQFTPTREMTPVEPRRPPRVQPEPPEIVLARPGPGVRSEPIRPIPREPTQIIRPPKTGLPLGVDRDPTPIIRFDPKFPPRAQEKGIQGWVQVRFTVTAVGTVRDAIVVASEPARTFDDAALEAVARWRYNPRVDGGIAVERVGLQALIRFTLDN
jgi:periplasmic protein TonB